MTDEERRYDLTKSILLMLLRGPTPAGMHVGHPISKAYATLAVAFADAVLDALGVKPTVDAIEQEDGTAFTTDDAVQIEPIHQRPFDSETIIRSGVAMLHSTAYTHKWTEQTFFALLQRHGFTDARQVTKGKFSEILRELKTTAIRQEIEANAHISA
jgi:hypothetical protein